MSSNHREGAANEQAQRNIIPAFMETFYLQLREWNPLYKRIHLLGTRLQNIIQLNSEDIDSENVQIDDFDGSLLIGDDTTPDMLAYLNDGEAAQLDVASVTDINIVGERVIRFRRREHEGGSWSQIGGTHALVEPLSYPLLFFGGEDGWGKEIRNHISFNSYICARLLMPEFDLYAQGREESYDPRGINTNRFVLLSRVGQTWLCDSVSRSIDYSLSWQTMSQAYIFGKTPASLEEENCDLNAGEYGMDGHGENSGTDRQLEGREEHVRNQRSNHDSMEAEWEDVGNAEYGQVHGAEIGGGGGLGAGGGAVIAGNGGMQDEADEAHENLMINGILNQADHPDSPGLRVESKANFLSDTFHGSRRHLRKLATNALVIITQRDTPHLFITFTCNKEWPEITSKLLLGTEAYDNPALVCEVFHYKLQALVHNLRTGKYFLDNATDTHSRHRIAYQMYVVEYQHRGLPHAHIVCRLTNMPDKTRPDLMLLWIQKHIRTVMPRLGENVDCIAYDKYSLEARRKMVNDKMKHTCYGSVDNSLHATCRDKHGMCKKGFDDMVLNDNNPSFDAKGFPTYGRKQIEDLHIVSYEMSMLMDANCHCNVEFCGSDYTCVYLYKYIFKGSKKEKFQLKNAEDIHDDDELNLYLRARMICSMDAC